MSRGGVPLRVVRLVCVCGGGYGWVPVPPFHPTEGGGRGRDHILGRAQDSYWKELVSPRHSPPLLFSEFSRAVGAQAALCGCLQSCR